MMTTEHLKEVDGRREWWEQIMLRHIAEHARAMDRLVRGMQFEPSVFAVRGRIQALGAALRDLRRHSRRWALRQIIRVSEALGLYEEDA